MAKRDLAKIGVKDLEQLEQPLPPGILIRGRLTLRRDDDGNESNRLVRFQCVGVEPGDAFEPKDEGADQGVGAGPDTTFDFGASAPPSGGGALEPSRDGAPPADVNGTPPTGADGAPPAGTNGTPTRPKRSRKRSGAAGTKGGTDQ
jgi:hypothetical protein